MIVQTLAAMISSGLKDEQRDAFQVWREALGQREMLAALKRKRQRAAGGGYGTTLDAAPGLLPTPTKALTGSNAAHPHGGQQGGYGGHGPGAEAMAAAADLGDHQLLLAGLFHNLPAVRAAASDPSLARLAAAADWVRSCSCPYFQALFCTLFPPVLFCTTRHRRHPITPLSSPYPCIPLQLSFSDHLDFWTRHAADGFQVLGYLPAAAAAVHLLCAGETAPRLQVPLMLKSPAPQSSPSGRPR